MSDVIKIEEQLNAITEKNKILPKHTNFQIEHFMLGKETSTNGKLWQCIRELGSRKENLTAVNLEIDETRDNLELANLKLEYFKNKPTFHKNVVLEKLANKKKEILIRKHERRIKNLESALVKVYERKTAILSECEKIIEVFNKHNPDNKPIDIDDEKNQLEYWNSRLMEEINLSAMCGVAPSVELIKSVLAMPNDSQVKIQLGNAMAGAKKLLN